MLLIGETLNTGQELFLVTYSILYGVLLQSLPPKLWPLAAIFKGRIKRDGTLEETEYIKVKRRRIKLSFTIFNFLPAVYLWFIITLLNELTLPPTWWGQLIFIIGVFWCSLGVFGFYRIFYIIVVKRWKCYFEDMIKYFNEDTKLSYYAKGHAMWALFYFLPGPIVLLITSLL